MIARASSATKKKKLTTCSGVPAKRSRSTGSWVAIPTGHVFRWQARIITQPVAIERRGREAHLVGAEQRGDHDVAAGLQLAVGLHPDPRAQVVHHERLLRLGEADLPRDRRRSAPSVSGEAPVPPSWPEISTWSALHFATPAATVPTPISATSFTDTCALRVRAAQVVDQLLQILDRVDVVVRRRRDQADARRREADLRDVRVDLVAGQLAALAGLRALRHLDLELVGVRQVVDVHAEAARGDLLDRRAARVAVRVAHVARRDPRRPRRCSTCRRAGSSRSRASRAPRATSEPSDIAPVEKRFTISAAGSTSSSGIGVGRLAEARAARAASPCGRRPRSRAARTARSSRSRRGAPRAAAARSSRGSTGGTRPRSRQA